VYLTYIYIATLGYVKLLLKEYIEDFILVFPLFIYGIF